MSDRPDDSRPAGAGKRKTPKAVALCPGLPPLLRKFVELAILAAIIATVLASPVVVPTELRTRLITAIADLNGGSMPAVREVSPAAFALDMMPLLSSATPAWELRLGAFGIIALLGVGFHLCAKMFETLSGRSVFDDPSRAPRRNRNVWRRRLFLACFIGLLCHAFASYFWDGWLALLPPVEGYGSELVSLQTGQMPRSLEGALLLALGFGWFLAAEDAARSRRFVYSLVGLIIVLGVAVSFGAIIAQRPDGAELSMGGLATAPLGAASTWLPAFLLPALLLAWTALCLGGRTGLRVADRAWICAALVVMIFALLEWADLPSLLIAVAGFALLVWLMRRRAGIEFSMTAVVGVPLVVGALVGFLMIMGDAPRAFRFAEFMEGNGSAGVAPAKLGVNDRMRVLFVSLPMIVENPLVGSGWGSFGYVYPEARARFFQLHPDTILTPAPFGLGYARSDALQLLFEAGLFGALLAFGGILMLLSAGWAALRGCVRQEHVTLQLGIFTSILVLLTFALIESAFRMPSAVAMALVMMAVWGNGERLWRLEVPRLEERVVGVADLREVDAQPEPRSAQPRRGRVLSLAMWAVGCLAVTAGVTFAGAAGGQWFSGRLLLAEGTRQMADATNPSIPGGLRRERLYAANSALDTARRLQPQAGDIFFESARLQLAFADDKLRETELVDPESTTTSPDVMRRLAHNDAQHGLMLLEEAERTVRGKELFRVRAMLFDAAARSGMGDTAELNRNALRSLGTAVRLNPGDSAPVVTLVRWMRASDVPTEQNVLDLYSFLYRFHPDEFQSHVIRHVERLTELCDDAEAYREARRLLTINPLDTELRLLRARTAFMAGDLATANTDTTALKSESVEGAVLLDAMIAARESAFSRALADAETIQTTPRTPQDAVQLELFIAVLRTRNLPTAREREEAFNNYRASIDDPAKEAALARMMSRVFLDHRKGQAIIREVIAESDGAASPQAWAILSDILVRTNSNALTLLRQLDRQPVGPTLPWERLRPPSSRTNIIEAIGHLVTARELATTEEDRLILRQRKRRLGVLLPPAERPGTGENDAEAE